MRSPFSFSSALLCSLICTWFVPKALFLAQAAVTSLPSLETVEDTVVVIETVEIVEIVVEVVDVIEYSNQTLFNNTTSHSHQHHPGHYGPGHNHFSQPAPLAVPNPDPSDPTSDSDPPPSSDQLPSSDIPANDPPPSSNSPANSGYYPVPNGRGPYISNGAYYSPSAPYHYATMAASAVVSGILALSSLVPSLPQSTTNGLSRAQTYNFGAWLICSLRRLHLGSSYDSRHP